MAGAKGPSINDAGLGGNPSDTDGRDAAVVPACWPNAQPEDMQAYGFDCPNTGAKMVALTVHTWTVMGTHTEALRRTAKSQDARIKELLGELAVAQHAAVDAEQRLNNVREVRRREKRAELEQGLITPGDTRFSLDKGK